MRPSKSDHASIELSMVRDILRGVPREVETADEFHVAALAEQERLLKTPKFQKKVAALREPEEG